MMQVLKVLLGNKTDLPGRAITTEQGQAVADEFDVHFFETSAKDGTNVAEGEVPQSSVTMGSQYIIGDSFCQASEARGASVFIDLMDDPVFLRFQCLGDGDRQAHRSGCLGRRQRRRECHHAGGQVGQEGLPIIGQGSGQPALCGGLTGNCLAGC
jgi:hypothetical protein